MNSAMSFKTRLFMTLCATGLIACSNPEPGKPVANEDAVVCKDPRPEMCTQEYLPVCATRDNGVRCVTTPCESTETVTYSNGCMACSDPAVYFYHPGACEKN